MKKVVIGTGLFVCGVMGLLTSVLKEAIYFASPNTIISYGRDSFFYCAIVFLIGGAVLCILGLLEDKK